MARYQVLADGVLDRTTGRVVLPFMPEFQDYRAWLDEGNTPDAPDPAPAAAPDRAYYETAGTNRRERELAKLSDQDFITHLRKGNGK